MRTAVIDLSYLRTHQAEHIAQELRGYRVMITAELIYEIMTSSDQCDPSAFLGMLLGRLRGMDVVQLRCIVELVKEEVRTGESTADVVDYDASQRLAKIFEQGPPSRVTVEVSQDVRDSFEHKEPSRLREALDRMWDPEFDEIFRQVPGSQDTSAQVRSYLALMEQLGPSSIGSRIAAELGMSRNPGSGWLIYEWERLRNFVAFRYRLNGTLSSTIPDKSLANNLVDLHYVALLSHADAIATCDCKLQKPLALAFGQGNTVVIGC